MKTIIRICGVVNLLFTAFHVLIGFWIWRMPVFSADARIIAEMLNTALIGVLLILGIALVVYAEEVIRTHIGRLILFLGAVTYLVRGCEEICLRQSPRPMILTVCFLAFVVHAIAFAKTQRAANAS